MRNSKDIKNRINELIKGDRFIKRKSRINGFNLALT